MDNYTSKIIRKILNQIDVDADGHWIWNGYVHVGSSNLAYGWMFFHGKQQGVHRIVHQIFSGSIPDGYEVDHLCRITLCVNPAHLEAVTSRENNRRSYSAAAVNARKTHCKYGHEFTEENIRINPGNPNARKCRACEQRPEHKERNRRAAAAWRLRKKMEALGAELPQTGGMSNPGA